MVCINIYDSDLKKRLFMVTTVHISQKLSPLNLIKIGRVVRTKEKKTERTHTCRNGKT